MGLQELRTEFNKAVAIVSYKYGVLTDSWNTCQSAIKVIKAYIAKGDDVANCDTLALYCLQKKVIKTEMLLINALRTKDVGKYKILLDKYREYSVELINHTEELGDCVSEFTGSKNEQAYIELCNGLKKNIDYYSEVLKLLIKHVYVENNCSE